MVNSSWLIVYGSWQIGVSSRFEVQNSRFKAKATGRFFVKVNVNEYVYE
jgi:hypothetical protein